VFLDDVHAPDSAVVGDPAAGVRYLFSALNAERLVVAAMSLGLGDCALRVGVEYAKVRAPFGKAIGSYQSVAHPLARAKVQIEAARVMLYQAAQAFEAGKDAGPLANIAKLMACDGGYAAVDAAIQCHGGAGFDSTCEIYWMQSFLRLLRVAPINTDMILNYLSERMLGLPKSY
jgi:alkylation response protein AidB-like acyl-CoA dehydrogenase